VLELVEHMRVRSLGRRGFITVLGGAAAWPLAGRAQQLERVRRVGVLIAFAENDPTAQAFVTAFAQALGRFGWVEGKNIRIDYRFAAGNPALFQTYAAELVGLSPDAILASTAPAVAAVRQQTHTIPIVFVLQPDPVGLGVVQSLARPGSNITGFASYDASIIGKWLQLLKEIAPRVTRVAVIFNPDTAFAPPLDREIEAAPSFGVTATLAPVRDDAAIEEVIAGQAREPGGGLVILPDSFNVTHRDVIISAAARHSLPLIGWEVPRTGGLVSYWYDAAELHAQAASYIDRILKGASPADLPVQYPTKYSLVINLETAKALGLTVPPRMLDLADQVIE
jgi:putative ABC transport system substrate-binding protein